MSVLHRLLRTAPPPAAALEITRDRVSAVSLQRRNGGAVVRAHALEPIPEGVVSPSLTGTNVPDPAAAAAAVGRALDQVGRPRRVALVLPDPVAKVSVVTFESTPPRQDDLERLIRFQVRKSAPFSIDDAQLTWAPGRTHGAGADYVVSMARRAVIEEYEGVVAAAGASAGLVDLATFNVINAVLAGQAPAGDWLLVHAPAGYVSIAVVRGADLVLFRNRSADADDTVAGMVYQTAMYYEDRLQGRGFSRVLLSGGGADGGGQDLRRDLQERLGAAVEGFNAGGAVTLADRISVSPATLDALAPAVGVLLRGSEAA